MKKLLGINYYTLQDIVSSDRTPLMPAWFAANQNFSLDDPDFVTYITGRLHHDRHRIIMQSDFGLDNDDEVSGYSDDKYMLYTAMHDFFGGNVERWKKIRTAMESAYTNAFSNPAFSRTRDEDITDTSSGSSSSNGYTTDNPTEPLILDDANASQFIDAGSASTGHTSGENVRDGTITETGTNGTKYSMEIAEDVSRVYQEVGEMIYNEFARRFFIL